MSKAADYFGLVAYMFVMYGGLPGSDSLWSDTREPAPSKGQRPKLRAVAAKGKPPRPRRRTTATAAAEAAA